MARNQNLTMVKSNTFSMDYTVLLNGTAVNITGATLRFTAKYNVTDADASAVFQLYSPSNGITITSASAGTGVITIPVSATSTVAEDTNGVPLYYDFQITDSGSNVYTLNYGVLKVLPNVTRTTP